MASPEYLTTGEAARLLGFPQKTMQKLYDRGKFIGVRHPTTGTRLIPVKQLYEFAQAQGYRKAARALGKLARSAGIETPQIATVICMSPEARVQQALERAGCKSEWYTWHGPIYTHLRSDLYDAAVLDCQLGTGDVERMGRYLHQVYPHTLLVCLTTEDGSDRLGELWQAGFAELWVPPADLDALAAKLRHRLTSPARVAGPPKATRDGAS